MELEVSVNILKLLNLKDFRVLAVQGGGSWMSGPGNNKATEGSFTMKVKKKNLASKSKSYGQAHVWDLVNKTENIGETIQWACWR